MKTQNKLALIVAYYLSRLDRKGYSLLGYRSFNEAVREIGRILDVKPNTVKNMRDEFDPYHPNNRVGWLRELRGSRQKVLKVFQDTEDEILLEIVKEIIHNKEFKDSEGYEAINALLRSDKAISAQEPAIFIVRGPTGKAAETFFVNYFNDTGKPMKGELIDSRDIGCGYDFEIKNKENSYFIEIKGLSLDSGGVLFTNKEWLMAQRYKKRYYLILIKNIFTNPEVTIIQDPVSRLKAKKHIHTTLCVNWSVSEKNIKSALRS